jgi:hypothetical protein
MEQLFNGLTIADYHDDLYRNIVSLRVSENLFDDLSDNPDAWRAAIDIEIASKPHTHTSNQPITARPFEEADYNQAINYPFQHWISTRYSNGSFGVWYGADTLETSVHETAYHWRRQFLEDSGWHNMDGIEIERKVYLVRCEAALLDFRLRVDKHPALIDPDSYHLTHQVGAKMHHNGHPGLVSRSARCEGDIFAIFNQRVLLNPRQLCYLTYRVDAGAAIVKRSSGETILKFPC